MGDAARFTIRFTSRCHACPRKLRQLSTLLDPQQLLFRPLVRPAVSRGTDTGHRFGFDGRALVAPFATEERQDAGNLLVVEGLIGAGHFDGAVGVEQLFAHADGPAQPVEHQAYQAIVTVEPLRIEQGRSLAGVAVAGRVVAGGAQGHVFLGGQINRAWCFAGSGARHAAGYTVSRGVRQSAHSIARCVGSLEPDALNKCRYNEMNCAPAYRGPMAPNLLRPTWGQLNTHELRILLAERVGRPGQYDGREANPNRLYLPLAGSQCRVVLTFRMVSMDGFYRDVVSMAVVSMAVVSMGSGFYGDAPRFRGNSAPDSGCRCGRAASFPGEAWLNVLLNLAPADLASVFQSMNQGRSLDFWLFVENRLAGGVIASTGQLGEAEVSRGPQDGIPVQRLDTEHVQAVRPQLACQLGCGQRKRKHVVEAAKQRLVKQVRVIRSCNDQAVRIILFQELQE